MKPTNYAQLEAFYIALAKENPWPTMVRAGETVKGNPMWRQMSPDELDESARRAAAELGWDVPEAVFSDPIGYDYSNGED
jgi:hypothetical protein